MQVIRIGAVTAAALVSLSGCAEAAGVLFGGGGETVDFPIATNLDVGPADAKASSIAAAAQAFLASLSAEQRKAAVYAFDDNQQRARWSNLPSGFVERGGIIRKDLNAQQLAALDNLLAEVLSADGLRNARLQMAADDLLKGADGPAADFGSEFYYVAFLGEPSADAAWMLQFGGHHMAYNVTFAGAKASFSPMLTGGQPLTVNFEGKQVYITRKEVDAARAFLASLTDQQRQQAIRSDTAINILLGPGQHGAVIGNEGVRAGDLNARQREMMLAVIEARISQFNARDAAAKMTEVRAGLSDTWFGWWGPREPAGAAYVRITGPKLMIEYGPQEMGGNPAEHAHNMYRDPTNDYGAAWITDK